MGGSTRIGNSEDTLRNIGITIMSLRYILAVLSPTLVVLRCAAMAPQTSPIVPQPSLVTDAHEATLVEAIEDGHNHNQDTIEWAAAECPTRCHGKLCYKPRPFTKTGEFAIGDVVDVKVLSKTDLGHWRGTGMWQRARVTSIEGTTIHLADDQGRHIDAALPSGIKKHHLRHAVDCAQVDPLEEPVSDGIEAADAAADADDGPVPSVPMPASAASSEEGI